MGQPIKVAFLLDSFCIAGGVGVILEYTSRLRGLGVDTCVIVSQPGEAQDWHPAGRLVNVMTYADARDMEFDIVIATWWKTCYQLHRLRSRHYAYLVQSIESRFYSDSDAFLKPIVTATYYLPVSFITEAKWIREYLTSLNPEADVNYIRNGVRKETFNLGDGQVEPRPNRDRPLRILIEGPIGVWFKQTTQAVDIAASLPFKKEVTLVTTSDVSNDIRRKTDKLYRRVPLEQMPEIYRNCDILLKVSRVEGMFGPPLEAFHCGTTAVCSWVTGADEYLVHGWNALVAMPDDCDSIKRYLELLNRDREFLHRLKYNALETAKGWPSWDQATRFLAAVLEKIASKHVSANAQSTLMIPALLQKGVDLSHTPNYSATRSGPDLAGTVDYGTELAELRKFREVILSSGSYRLARKISSLRQSAPMALLRRIVPDRLKYALKSRLIS